MEWNYNKQLDKLKSMIIQEIKNHPEFLPCEIEENEEIYFFYCNNFDKDDFFLNDFIQKILNGMSE